MTTRTRELIEEVRVLLHLPAETRDAAIDQLVEENRDDKLFVSLVKLQRALIPAIVQVWRENGLLEDEYEEADR